MCVGEEAEILETLEGQWRAALNKQRHKKKQVQQLQEDMQVCERKGLCYEEDTVVLLQAMQRRLGSLESERNGLEIMLDERKAAVVSLQKELTDMKAKKDRINRQVNSEG